VNLSQPPVDFNQLIGGKELGHEKRRDSTENRKVQKIKEKFKASRKRETEHRTHNTGEIE